jgi:transketolase C-terminal domain/subunit
MDTTHALSLYCKAHYLNNIHTKEINTLYGQKCGLLMLGQIVFTFIAVLQITNTAFAFNVDRTVEIIKLILLRVNLNVKLIYDDAIISNVIDSYSTLT